MRRRLRGFKFNLFCSSLYVVQQLVRKMDFYWFQIAPYRQYYLMTNRSFKKSVALITWRLTLGRNCLPVLYVWHHHQTQVSVIPFVPRCAIANWKCRDTAEKHPSSASPHPSPSHCQAHLVFVYKQPFCFMICMNTLHYSSVLSASYFHHF